VCVGVCVLPSPVIAAGPAPAFFGLQGHTLPGTGEIAMMKRGGAGTLRAVFDGGIQAFPESTRWSSYDALMAAASREQIAVLPVLIGIPGRRPRLDHPRTRAQRMGWARFVSGVAARYGRGGTFWAAHPDLAPMPITAYQVWNEPNLPAYWRPRGDAAGYLRLVRLTRARLRAIDPQATIVLGGLPDSRLGTPMLEYLRMVYAQPGARTLFDAVALNPYAATASGVLAKLNEVRAFMDRRGDGATPIWVTEIGWASGGPRSPFTTSPRGQAARLQRLLRALIAARLRLHLASVIVFGLQDRAYDPSEKPWWGPRVGLFDIAGRPKPAWATFVRFTGGRPGGRLRSVARRRPRRP
jgi:hypothetical protein